MTNVYWPVYKSLEEEVEKVLFYVHVDKSQENTYSSKIADIILRAAVEIESISKDLYEKYIPNPKSRRNTKYDYDAIDKLTPQWKLNEKIIIISHYNYHSSDQELYPFKKDTKLNKYIWNNAYQHLKHDRVQSLNYGSIKNMFEIMAALFILNLYYKDEVFDLKQNYLPDAIPKLSNLFNFEVSLLGYRYIKQIEYIKNNNFDSALYVIKKIEESEKYYEEKILNHKKKLEEILLKQPEIITACQTDKNFSILDDSIDVLEASKYGQILSLAAIELQKRDVLDKFEGIINKNDIF